MNWSTGSAALTFGIVTLMSPLGHAQIATPLNEKPRVLYVGYAPGGGYDSYARLIARHMGRYLPGAPPFVVQHRPGAGSVALANDLYNTLPRDGSVLGMFSNSLHLWEVLGQENIRFTSTKFNWIGRMSDADDVMAVSPSSGLSNFEDAKAKETTIGVPGSTSSPALMVGVLNRLLGTKFRMITGYSGSAETRLAVERGEVDGAQGLLWSVDGNWIQKNNLKVLYRVSSSEITGLESVPSLVDLAGEGDQKTLVRFFTSFTDVGRSIAAPPNVPIERVAELRSAFMKAIDDPAFTQEVEKSQLRLSPMSGEELQMLVQSTSALSSNLRVRAREAAGISAGGNR